MPRYSVSCTIHEAVLPQRPGGSPSDLLVLLRCFGSERTTTIKSNKTNIACWDESYHWTNIDISTSAWNLGVLEFELQSANAYWRNDSLGMCALQLRLVRATQDRCFVGRLPLTMPNSVRVIGHLSVTVNVYDSLRLDGSANMSLSSMPVESDQSENAVLQIPPLLSPLVYKNAALESYNEEYKYYHLYINIYSLEHLELGFFGFSPYVTVDYGSCRLQSSKPIRSHGTGGSRSRAARLTEKITGLFYGKDSGSKERYNFSFNQCFLIPIRTAVGKPILEDNIIVRIWMGVEVDPTLSGVNRPPISPKLIAEGVFSLAKLRARRQAPRWFNFYEDGDSDKCGLRQVGCTIDGVFNSTGIRGSKYIGRIMMSASVKRLSKPSDVLSAHVLSSNQFEPPIANPTRLFSDAYYIESSATFGFEGGFEVMLEVCCGPYEVATAWLPAQRRANGSASFSDDLRMLNLSAEGAPSGSSSVSNQGWMLTLDSITGRLPPLDLLVSYSAEQQWLICVRVKARGTIGGRQQQLVIGSTSFPLEHIPEHSSKSQSMPFWVPLACPAVPSLGPPDDGMSLLDPWTLMDKVSSIDSREMFDQAIAMDPTGLIGMAATQALSMYELANEGPQLGRSAEMAAPSGFPEFLSREPSRQASLVYDNRASTKSSNDKSGSLTRSSSSTQATSASDTSTVCHGNPRTRDACDPGTTVNVLITLHKHCFYSEMSTDTTVGYDLRTASHPRRVSMVKSDYELRCYIYCAKLGCAPQRGAAVTIGCDSKRCRTQVQRNFTRFPVFAECCVLSVAVPTMSSSGLASPIPITVSLIIFGPKRRVVRIESAVMTYHRLIKSASAHESSTAPSPSWLELSGGSEVLIFSELVVRGEAPKVPKYQLSPPTIKCSAKLGLLGFRNISLPEGYRLDAVKVRLYMQSYGVNVEADKSTEKVCPVGNSQWERGGKVSFDLFAVQQYIFEIPIDPLFDPHIEFLCFGISQGMVGPLLGYKSFPCYPDANGENLGKLLDLRHSLNPRNMVKALTDIALKSSQNIWMLQECSPRNAANGIRDGLPDVLSGFESSREFSRLLRSMTSEHVGIQVPPRFVLACDGREVKSKTVIGYITVASDILDKILYDIPFSVGSICPTVTCNRKDAPSRSLPRDQHSGLRGNLRRSVSKDGRDSGSEKSIASSNRRGISIETSNTALMKYFMTIQADGNGAIHRSYPEELSTVATSAEKMQRAFRSGLQNRIYKLRFCVVSANNLVPDCNTIGELFLAVEIGRSESRESLVCERGAIYRTIHRTWEQDVFLPEDSLIRLSVLNSLESFDGSLEDELIASAQIDLENRWYSKCWQRMLRKDTLPIERIILRDRNNNVHGSLDVIVQIGPVELFSTLKPLTFTKSSYAATEVRVIIWSTKGVRLPSTPSDSKKKDQLDLYVVSRLDCQGYRGEHPSEQVTDTHYNCDSGMGQFNWRVVYPQIQPPIGACQLQLSVYDLWKVGPPVFVGEVNLELKHYINVVSTTSNRIQITEDLPLVNASSTLPVGTLHITLQVFTQAESSCTPAGLGRSEPNCKPFLPTPQVGRQWHDWFAHTGVNFDFGALSFYVKGVSCTMLVLWLFFISFVYPALLM
ncbi:C2 domain-containing protein [Babesia divergens]|uniref:C2 domain-containing protein n=1 Tax=Babesia divergens TaxID=32595 RepID=A0AAD9GHG6_BABDI|nr:C2 domain-containing protein [Babesia divergens]